MITLDGRIEHITYQNRENHYTIARFRPENSAQPITIIGYLPGIIPEQTLSLQGKWKTHAKYGQQFAVESFQEALPADITGIRKYLASGIIKGIGSKIAERIIDQFGVETFNIIENDPRQLLAVEGIGEAKATLIQEAWTMHHIMRNLMSILQTNGIKASYASKILKVYGLEAIEVIHRDPFQMALDIPDVGFLIADRITQNQGYAPDDDKRIRACLLHVLQQAVNDGHTYVEEAALLERCETHFDIDRNLAGDMLQHLADAHEIVIDPDLIGEDRRILYLRRLFLAESGLEKRMKAFLAFPATNSPLPQETILETIAQKLAIQLSTEQLAILEKVLDNRISIITGGPGTGKTTLIRAIHALYETQGYKVALVAPTGRAARQLSKVTRRRAQTIHRLLGFNWKENCFEKNQDDPVDADVVIVDETSMVDLYIMFHLLNAISITSNLILVGDVFQLPSVGAGNVLADLIQSNVIPIFYLSQIFRQAEQSQIIVNAHAVRNGELPDFGQWHNNPTDCPQDKEFHFIPQPNPQKAAEIVLKICSRDVKGIFNLDPIRDVQVITPMHKGEAGTLNLNQMLQKALNPISPGQAKTAARFHPGDKVMHLVNNYQKEVFNGDIGIVQTVDPAANSLSVDFEGRTIIYDFGELDELSLAYAISIHKSQGSEYPAVVIPLLTQHYLLLQRNLLYTAITRAQNYVFLIGNPKAVTMAINNDKPRFRQSGLARRLMDGMDAEE